jgi:hypothetical protein
MSDSPSPMNKMQELHALEQFIVSLPHESYLRPWLEQELPSIRSAMQADMPLEHYCHGFEELHQISKRLDERGTQLNKLERGLTDAQLTLHSKLRGCASMLDLMVGAHEKHAQLLKSWAQDMREAEKKANPF